MVCCFCNSHEVKPKVVKEVKVVKIVKHQKFVVKVVKQQEYVKVVQEPPPMMKKVNYLTLITMMKNQNQVSMRKTVNIRVRK